MGSRYTILFVIILNSFSTELCAQGWQIRDHAYTLPAQFIWDAGEHFWTLSPGGFTRYDKQSHASRSFGPLEGASAEYPTTAAIDSNFNLWISYPSGRLVRFNGSRYDTVTFDNGTLQHPKILAMAAGREGNLYLAGRDIAQVPFIAALEGGKWDVYDKLPPDLGLTRIISDHEGVIWLAGYQGLFNKIIRFKDNAVSVYSEDDGIPHRSGIGISDLQVAPDGTIWTLNDNSVSQFRSGSWTRFDVDPEGEALTISPRSISFGPSGKVWAVGQGMAYYQGGFWTTLKTPPPHEWVIYGIVEHGNEIDAATNKGLFTGASTAWKKVETTPLGIEGAPLSLIFESGGSACIGFIDGIIRWTGSVREVYKSEASIPRLPSLTLGNTVLATDKGFWALFHESGIGYWDGQHWTTYDHNNGLINDTLSSIAFDKQGRVWAVGKGGIQSFDGSGWNHFRIEDSLSDRRSYGGLAFDSNNVLWTSSLSLVSRGEINGIPWMLPIPAIHSFNGVDWKTLTIPVKNPDGWLGANCLCADKNNRIYAIGERPQDSLYQYYGGYYVIDGDKIIEKELVPNSPFQFVQPGDIHCSQNGSIYYSLVNGVRSLTEIRDEDRIEHIDGSGLSSDALVTSIDENPMGELMIGTTRGVYWLRDGVQIRSVTTENGLLAREVNPVSITDTRSVVSMSSGIREEFQVTSKVNAHVDHGDPAVMYDPISRSLSIAGAAPLGQVLVLDVLGRTVAEIAGEQSANQTIYQLPTLEHGAYFVRFINWPELSGRFVY